MKTLVQYLTESKTANWDKWVELIKKNYYSIDDDDFIKYKWEDFDVEEQLEIIAQSGFEGYVLQDEIDNGCIVSLMKVCKNKEDILGWIDDCFYNRVEGYNEDDENHYVLKYKNNPKPIHSEDDFETKRKVPRSGLEWVSGNQGLSIDRCWYANEKAKNEMVKYMGFVEFHKPRRIEQGRGFEDYIS